MLCTALGRGPCAGLLGAAQTGQPCEDVLHHAGIQGIINILAALFIADKACGLQHREVVRYGGARGVELGAQLARAHLAAAQKLQNAPARGVSQGLERGLEQHAAHLPSTV